MPATVRSSPVNERGAVADSRPAAGGAAVPAANIEPLPAHGHWSVADADLLSVVDASDEDAVPLRRGAGSDGTSADSPAGVGRTDKSS